ncbi:MAG TPA: YceI family protein [Gemmatimonadales bacterium]|nr:YceI family protein [Gemmatimonadales bacterium]
MLTALFLLATVAATPTPPATSIPVWRVDPSHSELSFTIRHLSGRVRGSIAIWQGDIAADLSNLATGRVDVYAYPGSIDTGNKDRDEDLRGENFFDVGRFPTITFKSTEVRANGSKLTIIGDLTIKGVTRRVTLDGKLSGITRKDAKGAKRIAFLATTKIDRREFGLSWNKFVEGAAMLGDQVDVEIAIEAVEAGTRGE